MKEYRRIYVVDSPESLPESSIVLGEGEKASVTFLVFPGMSVDIPVSVEFTGENAELSLRGIYICGGGEKVNIRTDVRHNVPGCVSDQLVNGIAAGDAHVTFYGKIVVAHGAQKTQAYQSNHNVVLTPSAKVDTRPQLEIYADDVKCSHGATVGSLNEDEQFYMRSRGIPEAEAKVLQMISFVAPVLDDIEDEEKKAELSARVEEAIRSII